MRSLGLAAPAVPLVGPMLAGCLGHASDRRNPDADSWNVSASAHDGWETGVRFGDDHEHGDISGSAGLTTPETVWDIEGQRPAAFPPRCGRAPCTCVAGDVGWAGVSP